MTKSRILPSAEPMARDKADIVHRCVAKFIDLIIAGAMSQVVTIWGPLGGLTYLLIADGFHGGQSLGKRLIKLHVISASTGAPCDIRRSILRNLPVAVVFFFAMIPFIGWILFFTVGILIMAFEAYLIVSDDGGGRIGDILADTHVREDKA